jgi:hypothetical protein
VDDLRHGLKSDHQVNGPEPSNTPRELQPSCSGEPSDGEFIDLLGRCRSRGGLRRLSEVVRQLAAGSADSAIGLLFQDIGAHRALDWRWNGEWWVPQFQFCPATKRVRPVLRAWLCLVDGQASAWRLAAWLLTPQAALAGRCPADSLDESSDRLTAALQTALLDIGVVRRQPALCLSRDPQPDPAMLARRPASRQAEKVAANARPSASSGATS